MQLLSFMLSADITLLFSAAACDHGIKRHDDKASNPKPRPGCPAELCRSLAYLQAQVSRLSGKPATRATRFAVHHELPFVWHICSHKALKGTAGYQSFWKAYVLPPALSFAPRTEVEQRESDRPD